jgi:hypothetical protein
MPGPRTSSAEQGEALRTLAREHALPDVARLSDEQETRMSVALAGTHGLKGHLGRAYLHLRGYGGGCLAILGFEGAGEELASRRKRALALVRAGGGRALGRRGVAARALRRAVSARRAAHARCHGRDARGPAVVGADVPHLKAADAITGATITPA